MQLRALLAQLVMPRVAGRTTGPANQPAGTESEPAAAPESGAQAATAGRGSNSRRARPAALASADVRPQPRQQARPQTRPQAKSQTRSQARPQTGHPTGHPISPASAEAACGTSEPAAAETVLSASQIDAAARDLVTGASHTLDQLLAGRSGSRATIAEAVLAPVARRLGVLWEDDDASFAEVSAALGLLSRRFAALPGLPVRRHGHTTRSSAGDCGTILLVAAPGDTHVFGLSVVGAAFEEAGWTVMCHPAASRAEIIEQVASRWIDVLAITVSWTDAMRSVPDLVAAARLASLNPDLRVLAGGGAVAQLDDACSALHADAVAVSAVQAVAVAQQMLPVRATPV